MEGNLPVGHKALAVGIKLSYNTAIFRVRVLAPELNKIIKNISLYGFFDFRIRGIG